MSHSDPLDDLDSSTQTEEEYTPPPDTSFAVYIPEDDDTTIEGPIFITTVTPRAVKAHFSRPIEHPQAKLHQPPAVVVSHLASHPDGFGVLYYTHPATSLQSQMLSLQAVARRAGLRLMIDDYSPGTWLITCESRGKYQITTPPLLNRREVENFKRSKKKETPTFRIGDQAPYKAYLKTLMGEDVSGTLGILYPISASAPIVQQQQRLHMEARRMGYRISVVKWDDMNFLVRFTSYLDNEPVYKSHVVKK